MLLLHNCYCAAVMICNADLCVFLGNCCEKVVQPPEGWRPTGWEPLAVPALSLHWHSGFFTWLASCVLGCGPQFLTRHLFPLQLDTQSFIGLISLPSAFLITLSQNRHCLLAVSSLCFLCNFDKFGTNFLLDGMNTSVWLSDCLSGQGLTMEPWLAGAHSLPLSQECWD